MFLVCFYLRSKLDLISEEPGFVGGGYVVMTGADKTQLCYLVLQM